MLMLGAIRNLLGNSGLKLIRIWGLLNNNKFCSYTLEEAQEHFHA